MRADRSDVIDNAIEAAYSLPMMVPEPLPAWLKPYAAMAREDQLAWPTLDEVTRAARAFLDPVLASDLEAALDPALWSS